MDDTAKKSSRNLVTDPKIIRLFCSKFSASRILVESFSPAHWNSFYRKKEWSFQILWRLAKTNRDFQLKFLSPFRVSHCDCRYPIIFMTFHYDFQILPCFWPINLSKAEEQRTVNRVVKQRQIFFQTVWKLAVPICPLITGFYRYISASNFELRVLIGLYLHAIYRHSAKDLTFLTKQTLEFENPQQIWVTF